MMKPERESRSVVSDSLQPHGLHSSWNFSRPECRSGQPFPSPGDLPNPGIEPRSAALPSDSIPAEPPGKPKNTEESSLSLLQGIFPPQESNWGLLNCRQILYQLSYQGSPSETRSVMSNSLQLKIVEWGSCSLLHGSSQPRDRTHISRIVVDSLTAEPPGKPT